MSGSNNRAESVCPPKKTKKQRYDINSLVCAVSALNESTRSGVKNNGQYQKVKKGIVNIFSTYQYDAFRSGLVVTPGQFNALFNGLSGLAWDDSDLMSDLSWFFSAFIFAYVHDQNALLSKHQGVHGVLCDLVKYTYRARSETWLLELMADHIAPMQANSMIYEWLGDQCTDLFLGDGMFDSAYAKSALSYYSQSITLMLPNRESKEKKSLLGSLLNIIECWQEKRGFLDLKHVLGEEEFIRTVDDYFSKFSDYWRLLGGLERKRYGISHGAVFSFYRDLRQYMTVHAGYDHQLPGAQKPESEWSCLVALLAKHREFIQSVVMSGFIVQSGSRALKQAHNNVTKQMAPWDPNGASPKGSVFLGLGDPCSFDAIGHAVKGKQYQGDAPGRAGAMITGIKKAKGVPFVLLAPKSSDAGYHPGFFSGGGSGQLFPPRVEKVLSQVLGGGWLGAVMANYAVCKQAQDACPYTEDTAANEATWEAASYKMSEVLLAAEETVKPGSPRSALVASNLPGHHASADLKHGFCFINYVAVAAIYQAMLGKKVLIIDIDVHSGDGTQSLIERALAANPNLASNIRFINSYEVNLFAAPSGPGEKGPVIYNRPYGKDVSSLSGGAIRGLIMESVIEIKNKDFEPDMIFWSLGIDAHERDEFSRSKMTSSDYAQAVEEVDHAFDQMTPTVIGLEGGYNAQALEETVSLVAQRLNKFAATPQNNGVVALN